MSSKGKITFPGRRSDEKVYLFFRRHPLSFFGFSLIGLVMVVLPIVVLYFVIDGGVLVLDGEFDTKIMIALMSSYLLFVLGMMVVAWMNFYLDVYIVTDKRLIDIHQVGLFSRSLSGVDLVDVEDVKADVNGILATYFNFGNVYVQTAGELQNVEFTDVPEPYKLARKVMDYHEQAVREQRAKAIKKATDEEKQKETQSLSKSFEEKEPNNIGEEMDTNIKPKSTEIEEVRESEDISGKKKDFTSNRELKEGEEVDL
jgi:uncharacterized membrane protein YdbT with pleckstrin-like domain